MKRPNFLELLNKLQFAAAGSFLTLIALRFAGFAGLVGFSLTAFALFTFTLLAFIYVKRKRSGSGIANG